MLGLGIDTGGTCTDAVIFDMNTKQILGSGKALTTKSRLETGISEAIDRLPEELVKKVELVALSTTLATNACVEDKGARAKLLMLGFEETMMERLKNIYASYGFQNRSDFVIMDAKVENLFPDAFDPDWDYLKEHAEEIFQECDSIGIVQKHPRANGGRFELTARELLQETLMLPITIAQDISHDVDILKTSAGTMLNARLIPLISEFLEAIHEVLRQRSLDVPINIVRSDGTLMSEEMAKIYPVETLLCGPAASVVGGLELSGEKSGVIVDMGGTTTDIAIIHDFEPVMEDKGIHIGQWQTMVKGLYVDTFGLGGDTAVRYANGEVYLEKSRIIPLSVLAAQYDYVVPKLKKLLEKKQIHGRWIHEFYVLQKDISGKMGYTREEQEICDALKNGPLISMDLAAIVDKDPYYMKTDRLERDGILIKSGLTPTDMMILKDEFTLYEKEAATLATEYLAFNIKKNPEDIPDIVYDQVTRRMYKNLGRILLAQQYPKKKELFADANIEIMLDFFYEQAKMRMNGSEEELDAGLSLTTDLPLIGVGAPIHVFLPRVAQLLGTRVIIPQYSEVTNALGAIACKTIASAELIVKAEYKGMLFSGFSVFSKGKKYLFADYEKAEEFGKEVLTEIIRQKALLQGIADPEIEIQARKKTATALGTGIFFETILYAKAKELK